jgi:hypothetical protein
MLDAAAKVAGCARAGEVSRMLKKVLTWAAVVFVVYYLATQPAGAAHFVHGVFTWLHSAGNSLSKFVNSL